MAVIPAAKFRTDELVFVRDIEAPVRVIGNAIGRRADGDLSYQGVTSNPATLVDFMESEVEAAERQLPLKVQLVGGRLIIAIGLDTLKHAIEMGPTMAVANHEAGGSIQAEITNIDIFATELLRELISENEIGETVVHAMFDHAARRAIENGADGVWMPGDQQPTLFSEP